MEEQVTGITDWRRFEKRSTAEREILAEREDESRNRAAYQRYVETVEKEQERVAPRFRIVPLNYEEWSSYISPNDPVGLREQLATNRALLKQAAMEDQRQRDAAAEDVRAGKTDPAFEIPESAEGLSMSVEQAKEYACKQAELFVSHNPEYYPTAKNFQAISKYLAEQTNVVIPDEQCFRLAWLRLRELGLMEERPEPTPEPQSPEPINNPELVDGFDPETGEPRKFTQAEIWRMDSTTYRKAFRMWGDTRPRFTRGYFG